MGEPVEEEKKEEEVVAEAADTVKVDEHEKHKAANKVKEVIVKKEHGKPDKVKIGQSEKEKAKQKAKGVVTSTKT